MKHTIFTKGPMASLKELWGPPAIWSAMTTFINRDCDQIITERGKEILNDPNIDYKIVDSEIIITPKADKNNK